MNNSDLKDRVARIVREEVAPALEIDGTEVEVVDVSDGIAQIRFTGACSSCPATITALIMGVEQELRSRIPEVQYLEAVP
jgi:Fe-S cluster biogenesis protein NfuA